MKGFVHTVTAKAFAGFLILAIVFGAGGYFIYRSLDELDPTVQRIREPNNTIRLWREVTQGSNTAITHMRHYFLTGDTTSLFSFEEKRVLITKQLDSLRALAGNDSKRLRRIDTLDALLNRKLEESTFGAVSLAENSQMSIAIDNAVQELAIMERKREQDLLASQEKQNASPSQPTETNKESKEPKKDRFWQRLLGKTKNKNEGDTSMNIEAIASMLDSIIVAAELDDPQKTSRDTMTQAMKIAEELSNAKTRDFEAREAELKEELRLLAQRRTTDSLISELTGRMSETEQEATADLIGEASTQVRSSTGEIIYILSIGAIALIVLFTLVIRNDVNRAAKLRAHIEKARQRAEQLARTREEFAANMSHEIRSPLNTIMGISEQLAKHPDGENKKLIEGLTSASQYLLGLINPVLDVTKLNSGKIEFENQPFNLHETLADVQRAFQTATSRRDVKLELIINGNVPVWIMGDDVRLRQILFNLVGNSVKFTDKGRITISCNDLGPGEEGKHLLKFIVADTGIGIDPSAIDKIFDEYSQADSSIARKFGGTGLGLTISKKLVELQKGRITVSSQPGVRTEFTFELPFSLADQKQSSQGQNTRVTQNIAGKKFLVCDDEAMNRMLATMIITNFGGQVTECGSGEETIELLGKEDYDLLLLDINLPGIDGKKTLATLRALGKNLPVIAVTGNAHEEPSLRKSGFSSVLIKPYQEADLLNLVNLQMVDA